LFLGAKTINICGADFAYPNGQCYNRASYFYPAFRRSENRLSPVEAQNARFLYANKSLELHRRAYTSSRMAAYKNSLLSIIKSAGAEIETIQNGIQRVHVDKTAVTRAVPNLASGQLQRTAITEFLHSYKSAVTAFGSNDKEILFTLLPLVASFQKVYNNASVKELFKIAQEYVVNRIDAVTEVYNV
jgi:hypothetical protein